VADCAVVTRSGKLMQLCNVCFQAFAYRNDLADQKHRINFAKLYQQNQIYSLQQPPS